MSLFGELDVQSAADDPFGKVPDAMYACTLESAKVVESKDKFEREGVLKKGLSLLYTITEGEEMGEQISEYKAIPQPEDPSDVSSWTKEEKRAASFLKQRLLSLDVPEDRVNSVEPSDLEGIECYVTVKTNGQYQNVTEVKTVAEPVEF